MKNKLLAGGIFIFTLLGFASTAYAVHYVTGWSSVDENEIRWGGGTKYGTQLTNSIATWNARRRVNIAPDTAATIEDLTISDVNRSDRGWVGVTGITTRRVGADTLQLNSFYLDRNTSDQKQNTITHELGHALGLDHSVDGNIMARFQSSLKTLGPQDISDYRFLWGG